MLTTHALLIEFQQFVLIFLRTLSAIGLLPLLGGRLVPAVVKIGLAGMMAYLLTPVIGMDPARLPGTVPAYAYLAVQEVMVGLVLGFAGSLLFMGVQAAGELLGIQMGLSISQAIDPQTQSQVSLIGQLAYILAMLMFLVWDGHHAFIAALRESFSRVPIASFDPLNLPVEHLVRLFGQMLVLGVRVAAPVIAPLLLTTLLFAMIGRMAPRMNVFMLTFPVSIGIGLVTLGFALEPAARVFNGAYLVLQETLRAMILHMGP
jgi:flagellar biosynthetic protein FliR